MPALSIYDTDGTRLGEEADSESDRIRRFSSNGGRLTLDASGETTRVVVLFSAAESQSAEPEQFYAVFQGDPQMLHAGLRKRLKSVHGLTLVPDDNSVYEMFVPGETTPDPDRTDLLEEADSLLTDGSVSQVKLGVDSYGRARRVVQYFLREGAASKVAVADSVDSAELQKLDAVVEHGAYDGIELLPETERHLGEDDPAAGRPSADDRWSEPVTPPGRDPDSGDDSPRTAMILSILGAVALVLLLGLGAALGGGIPFVGGGGEEVALELDSATVEGADGVVVEGQLTGTRVDDTSFTVRLFEGGQSAGEELVETQVAATPLGGGQFNVTVDPEQLAAGGEFSYLGGTDYEVVVETDEDASGSAQVQPAGLDLALTDVQWTNDSVDVTGTLTQGRAAVYGDPAIDLTVGDETTTRTVTLNDDGTFGFTVTDDQTARNLSASGNLTITTAYEGAEDSIRATRPEPPDPDPPDPANFEVAIQERSSPVTAGQSLSVTVEIANTGESGATQTVTLDAPPLGTDSATVTLGGNASATQTFTVETAAGDAGDYSVDVSSENATDSTTVTVEQQQLEAEFTVEITGTNTPVEAGGDIVVTTDIANTGDAGATQTVQFQAGPLGSDSATVTLSPGDTTTETFAVGTTSEAVGEFVVGVGSEDDDDTAFVAIEGEDDNGSVGSLQVSIENTTAPVTEGETLSIDVSVTNTGAENRTETVDVEAGSLGTDSVEVSLSGGATTTRTFSFETTSGDAGQYPVTVSAADSTTTAELSVESTGTPSFQVLIGQTSDATVGSPLGVTFVVTNAGDARGTDTVTLSTSPGLTTRSFDVTLDPGDSVEEAVSVPTEPGDAGEYEVSVTTSDDQATESLTVEGGDAGTFDVSISGTNAPVTVGDPLAVDVEITNTGGSSATRTVTLSSEPSLGSDSTSVTLGAGDSTEETLSVGTSQSGQYDLTVASDESEDTVTVTVEAAAEATYDVSIAGTNAPVTAGQTLEVTAEIANTAQVDGSRPVELTAGSLGTTSTQVAVPAGASTTETLAIDTVAGDAGEYTVTLGSNSSQDTATVTVGAATAQLELSALDIAGQGDSAAISEGQNAQIAVDVTNVGGEAPDSPVEVSIDIFAASFSDTVQPGPGETQTATVGDATGSLPAGTYDVTASVGDESLGGSLTVEIPASLPGLDIGAPGQGSSATISAGDDEDIFVNVVNDGADPNSFSVNLKIQGPDGVVVDRTSDTDEIEPDGGFVVTFESVTGDLSPGEYSIVAKTVEYGDDETTGGSLTVQGATGSSLTTGTPALAPR